MNKRLAITAQKAIGKGKLLWLDCYNDAIYQDIAPTIKTNYYQEQMHFLMEQGEINETQIPQQEYPKMKTDKMLNVITLFSGYDSQCLALNRLGVPYNLAAWCEIDKHAITAHNALFPQWKDRNLGDVSKVDWQAFKAEHPEPIDLLTYSSPCQDFSSAGMQAGGDEGSGTRSGLLWEVEKAIAALKPRHLVFENVAALVSDKFIGVFNKWQSRLNSYGYTNFQQLMNAKDYCVPQNRLRIFMVSILDCDRAYYFPKPFPLTRRLKDVLEQNADERYYLSDERVAKLMQETAIHSDRGNVFAFRPHTPEEIASTVKCSGIGDKTDNFVAEPLSDRQASIKAKVMPNGDIRCYRDVPGKPGVSELQFTHPDNESPILTCEAQIKIIEPQINILGKLSSSQNSRIIGTDGISPAVINGEKDGIPKIVEQQDLVSIPDGKGGYKQVDRESEEWYRYSNEYWEKNNSLIVPQATKEGYAVVPEGGVFDASYPDSKTRRGRVQEGGTVSPTIMASQNELLRYEGTAPSVIEPTIIDATNDFSEEEKRTYTEYTPALRSSRSGLMTTEGIRIRRLTERELYKLMDLEEKDIDTLLAAPIPRTQHAKLAGNSIVVACLYYIFRNLFVNTEPEAGTQTKLF